MKRAGIAALAALLLTGCGSRANAQKRTKSVFAMDTYMELTAYGGAADALDAAEEKIRALEKTFSVTDSASELWYANHAAGASVLISADTAALLRTAESVRAESGNALQISVYPVVQAWGFTTGEYRVPAKNEISALLENVDDTRISFTNDTLAVPDGMQIDFGALAKGYTGDVLAAQLREAGVTSAILNLGGNVQTVGTKPDGEKWVIGIQDPFSPELLLGTLAAADCAVITSGNYERYFTAEDGTKYWHIIDPADGYPADNGLVSVTVIGKSGLRCDALSTALFVEGTERAAAHWRSCDDFEMVLVTADARILVTEGIASDFSNRSAMPTEVLTK